MIRYYTIVATSLLRKEEKQGKLSKIQVFEEIIRKMPRNEIIPFTNPAPI